MGTDETCLSPQAWLMDSLDGKEGLTICHSASGSNALSAECIQIASKEPIFSGS